MKITPLLLNPFKWSQERTLLIVGLTALALSVFVSHFCHVEFQILRINPLNKVTVWKALFNQVVIVSVLSLFFFIAGKIVNGKTRFIDIFNTVIVGFIPFYILGLQNINHFQTREINALEQAVQDGGIYSYLPSPLFIILAIVSLVFIVYYIYLFVIGFRTATHSKRVGHYVTFVLALIIADLAASYIINSFNF